MKKKKSVKDEKYSLIRGLEARVRSFDSDAAFELSQFTDYAGDTKPLLDIFMYMIENDLPLMGLKEKSEGAFVSVGKSIFDQAEEMADDFVVHSPHYPKHFEQTKNNRGRKSQYSQEERDEVVILWLEKEKQNSSNETLNFFLVDKFGEKDPDDLNMRPNVSTSTFYRWRKDYLFRNP